MNRERIIELLMEIGHTKQDAKFICDYYLTINESGEFENLEMAENALRED